MLKYNRKPPTYTLHLASKARKVLKFCLIPHFIIGLLMYSNSAIITPEDLQLGIQNLIHLDSRYLNPLRYTNVHSVLFLVALSVFLALLVVRFTLVCFFRTLYQECFKGLKRYIVRHDRYEVTSDNVYKDLPLKHLKREYDKAVEDLNGAEKAMQSQMYSAERLTVVREFKAKLETKMATLMAELRARCGLDEQWPAQEVLKSVE